MATEGKEKHERMFGTLTLKEREGAEEVCVCGGAISLGNKLEELSVTVRQKL